MSHSVKLFALSEPVVRNTTTKPSRPSEPEPNVPTIRKTPIMGISIRAGDAHFTRGKQVGNKSGGFRLTTAVDLCLLCPQKRTSPRQLPPHRVRSRRLKWFLEFTFQQTCGHGEARLVRNAGHPEAAIGRLCVDSVAR